jgi:hypothetical protein
VQIFSSHEIELIETFYKFVRSVYSSNPHFALPVFGIKRILN